jgi:hypothetical protein
VFPGWMLANYIAYEEELFEELIPT